MSHPYYLSMAFNKGVKGSFSKVTKENIYTRTKEINNLYCLFPLNNENQAVEHKIQDKVILFPKGCLSFSYF